MGRPEQLTYLLGNLYAGQEATVGTAHETTDWLQFGKGVCQGCISSPCLFNLYAEHVMWNARLDEAQAGIKIVGRNINNHHYGRKGRGNKKPLDKGERRKWKSWLKTQRSKTKIMAFSPIASWQIGGGKVETVTGFISLGSKITVDSDCSHEIKRCLILGRKKWQT